MADLDEFAGSKRYFRGKGWSGARGGLNHKALARAVHALGGKLTIEWPDE